VSFLLVVLVLKCEDTDSDPPPGPFNVPVHPHCLFPVQTPAGRARRCQIRSPKCNRSASSRAFQASERTRSFISVFNVVNGQLNELQFVIFMVNLKSCSCWLILLVGGKTRRNSCRRRSNSNRHFMLNYVYGQNKRRAGLRGPAASSPERNDPRSADTAHP
jgi:hypothetical protein